MSRSSTTKASRAAYLDAATIESTSHLDGRLSLVNRDGFSVFLEEGDVVHLVPPRIDVIRIAHVGSIEPSGKGKAIVRFKEVDSIDKAKELVGMHCLIEQSDVESRMTFSDSAERDMLADFTFLDSSSGETGEILRTWSASGNLVAEVRLDNDADDKVHLIPLAQDFIVEEDSSAKHLDLCLPVGIFQI